MNKFLRLISRLAFLGLLLFELLNYFKLLHFTLDFTWLGLVWTVSVIWFFTEILSFYLKKKCQRPLSGLIFLLITLVVYFDAGGDVFHLYSRFNWYDQVMHLAGGGAATLIIFYLLLIFNSCQIIKLGRFALSLFALGVSAIFGMLYEIEEYLEDYFKGTNRLGDAFDTANDLLLDLLGGLFILFILLTSFWLRGIVKRTCGKVQKD